MDSIDTVLNHAEQAMVNEAMRVSVIGTPERIRDGLARLIAQYAPDELILNSAIHDHAARLRSFEIAAAQMQALAAA